MPTGSKIKEIRIKKGLTQKQLGDLCGMADSAIRRYENGKANPKIETLEKISIALGVPIYELLGFERKDAINYAAEKIYTSNSDDEQKMASIIASGLLEDRQTDALLSYFRNLNNKGKTVAIDRVEELTKITDYTKKNAIKTTKKSMILKKVEKE